MITCLYTICCSYHGESCDCTALDPILKLDIQLNPVIAEFSGPKYFFYCRVFLIDNIWNYKLYGTKIHFSLKAGFPNQRASGIGVPLYSLDKMVTC